ncbi:MAG TPA: LuxR C-terminal-related transcriptional regulator [Nocardioidaceae bacterium]|nr:LuxR C-terminal-related transcriptional regulator [Nocardioidaceae bacterium]
MTRAPETRPQPVEDGRTALRSGQWQEARRRFEAGGAGGDPEALEGLAWACWWLSDERALFAAREAAYRGWSAAGRPVDAARVATWLGTDSFDFRGDAAVGLGWLRRARSLLEGTGTTPELGWWHVHQAEKVLISGHLEEACDLAREAYRIGDELALGDLRMMASATEGLARIYDGDDAGMPLLAEAATAAVADEFAEPWAAGWCCCYLIYGCEQLRDYAGAAAWCRSIDEWSKRWNIRFINRACRAHYAGVLIWQGIWDDAEAELTIPSDELPLVRRPTVTEVVVRLAELRRRQGRIEEAESMFLESADHPLAILGLGELRLDLDDPTGARERAEEYLRLAGTEAAGPRAAGLELLARACARLGDVDSAAGVLEELQGLAARMGIEPVLAAAAFARGMVSAAEQDADRARVAFEDAIRHYRRSGAPYEESLARLALARQLHAVGRGRDATVHAAAARRVLSRIGATRAAAEAEGLASAAIRPATGDTPLTSRELEVLRLVAAGSTNREMARQLVLSEHTVNRHVTNILTKLGTGSRSAAVAEAMRQGLM